MKSINVIIWIVGTLNQLFIRNSYIPLKFHKNKVVSWKTPLALIGPFFTLHFFLLKLAFYRSVFYGGVAFLIPVLSTKKRHSSFIKKFLIFQKNNFNFKVVKTSTISSDCHIRVYCSLKQRAVLRIHIVSF